MTMWKATFVLACLAVLVLTVSSNDAPVAKAKAQASATAYLDRSGPVVCRKDEIYTDFKNRDCTPLKCSELGFPLKCNQRKSGCICKDNTVRANNGACVPVDQCPSCGGDLKAKSGCGSNCGRTCGTYQNKETFCTFSCIQNGCECKDGFVYDPQVKQCVAPSQCTPVCGANEIPSTCSNGGCGPFKCSDLGYLIQCIDPLNCTKGCVCQDTYLRADNGRCVPKNQCPGPCGGDPNAQPGCGINCGRTCSTYMVKEPICTTLCEDNGCDCKDNFVYDPSEEKCVLTKDCTPICGINEIASSCANGRCGPSKCSDLGFPISCVDPLNCTKGCVCQNTYLRADNGTCVPKDQCPGPCGGDPNAQPGCGTNCGRTCSTYMVKDPICPAICEDNGCDCKDNFVYDPNVDKCVLTKDCSPVCGINEIASSCANGGCEPSKCSDLGRPLLCMDPVNCTKGCICQNTYVRADNGTCVPKEQCPGSCGGDPNAKPGCGVNCGKTCSTYMVKDPICPLFCNPNGCDCKDNFVYDPNVDKCVLTEDCTPTCGLYEVYSSCTNGGCDARNCSQFGRPVPCAKLDPQYCIKGCICQPGYLRNSRGVCVPQDQCQSTTCSGQYEYFDSCISGCTNQTCDDIGKILSCPLEPAACRMGCRCNRGFYRNSDNVCISESQCTTCSGQNEYFDTCIYGCSNQTCDDIGRIYYCPLEPTGCRTGCRCSPGFYRNASNVCVPESQCPTCSGQNEYFDSCISGCRNQSCDEIGKIFNCPFEPATCITGCRCISGFYRNENDVCIPENQCPTPTCPNYEIYSECPTVKCDGDYCPQTRNSLLTCPVGIVCDPSRCICELNRRRDRRTGKCIATADCPPFPCNGPNEEYQSCPASCPGDSCSDYINNSTCLRFRIGMVVPCMPQCKCKPGYYRNEAGICITGSECSCSGQNEYFDTCISGCSNQTCDDIGKIFNCPLEPSACRSGCRCNPGFYRNASNVCVPDSQCPTKPCPDNEFYNECPTVECEGDYCPETRYSRLLPCPVGIECDPPRCVCGFNSRRDQQTGKCITTADCPPFPCDGPNEEYQSCPPICPGDSCSDYINNSTCSRFRIGIIVPCMPQCKCKPGYYRNTAGVCIIASQCLTPCGPNEMLSSCINGGCFAQNCSQIGKPVACKNPDPDNCIKGCVCKEDYLRDSDGTCVPRDQCPPPNPCGPNEVQSSCANGGCGARNCSQIGQQVACKHLDPENCIKGCVCKQDYLRNPNGTCVPKGQCPPPDNQCGTNEVYDSCPLACPSQKCGVNPALILCAPGPNPGDAACNPGCQCIDGYLRDDLNVCIPKEKCRKICSSIEDGDSSIIDPTRLEAGVTDFTGKFLYDRMQATQGENIIISAFSVFTPLAQLALYASGDSLKQLLTILNANNINDIRTNFPLLTASIEKQQYVNFTLAAIVYSNKKYKLSDCFKNDSVDILDTGAQELDFSNHFLAASIINAWVANKTNTLINNLVSPDMFNEATRIVLVNAIFFKGNWLNQFNEDDTKDETFYLEDGNTTTAKLMYQEDNFNYGEIDDLDCQVLEMFYDGKNFSMFVALPNQVDGVTALAEKFRDSSVFNRAYGSLSNNQVKVWFPKFEIKTTTNLADILQQQNVTHIFDPTDSGINGILAEPEDIYITTAIQDALIIVNEEGSEAAAANAFVGFASAAIFAPPLEITFKADRSFLFYICIEGDSSLCIFSGTFRKPY